MRQGTFTLQGRNPDVLSCIANLSSDEIFTPPQFVDRILDEVAKAWADRHHGANIWADKDVRFLDPFTKSGVFLRQIAARLTVGLQNEIPDLAARVDHIMSRQLYGMAITSLTGMLARRSLYCSKYANGQHSVARSFTTPEGNIWFERTEHTWFKGHCTFCGVSEREYDRGSQLETHAYALIHARNPAELLSNIFGDDMQFDVIIGNPPYQLGSDGGTRDVPIYQKFVEQAKRLEPQLLCMVIPSRWMATGLGLTDFRQKMLADRRIRTLVDYPVAREVFPEVEVKGGICYFVWDRDYDGTTAVTSIRDGVKIGPYQRQLNEHDVLVRDYRAVEILRKVLNRNEESITRILSVDKEFGWTSNFAQFRQRKLPGDVPLYYGRKGKRFVGYVGRKQIVKSGHLVDKWKVMVPKAGSDGGQRLPDPVLGKPFIAPSPSVCTQTFLFFYADTEAEAQSIQSYLITRFFRFLVSLRKITHDATRSTYTWVPMQVWDREWTDEALFEKYGVTEAEASYIKAMVKEMEVGNE